MLGIRNCHIDSKLTKPNVACSSSSSSSALIKKMINTPSLIILEGGPQAFHNDIPVNIIDLIHRYWNFDCCELIQVQQNLEYKNSLSLPPITCHQSFFTPSSLAALLAHYIAYGQLTEVMAIVEKFPFLLKPIHIVRTKDPRGRQIQGTLLQIAWAVGDVNFRIELPGEELYGIAEHLADFALKNAILTKEQIQMQWHIQFPTNWRKNMDARMKPLLDAGEQFIEDIIRNVPIDLNYHESIKKCEPYIEKFNAAIKPDPNEVITNGLVYDLEVCHKFGARIDRMNRTSQHTLNVLRVVGYGGYQRLASVADAYAIRHGLHDIIHFQQVPPRSLLLANTERYKANRSYLKIWLSAKEWNISYYSNKWLGHEVFLDDRGQSKHLVSPDSNTNYFQLIQKFISRKNSNIEEFTQRWSKLHRIERP